MSKNIALMLRYSTSALVTVMFVIALSVIVSRHGFVQDSEMPAEAEASLACWFVGFVALYSRRVSY